MAEIIGTSTVVEPVARGAFVGQADFTGCIAFCNWRHDDARALLPPELELVAAGDDPAVHPVVFLFGEQSQGATIFGGLTIPWGVRYFEFGLAIPYVRDRRGERTQTFIARMCSSYFPAVWHGNAHYGFLKELTAMRWSGPVFLMTTPAGDLLFHAAVEPQEPWTPGAACQLPNFDAMRRAFALPILGRRADGTYVGSCFDWDFSAARVRPLRAALSIDAPFARGLVPHRCYTLPDATFEVDRMRWRLSWPMAAQP